jgi:hypothetical protein
MKLFKFLKKSMHKHQCNKCFKSYECSGKCTGSYIQSCPNCSENEQLIKTDKFFSENTLEICYDLERQVEENLYHIHSCPICKETYACCCIIADNNQRLECEKCYQIIKK